MAAHTATSSLSPSEPEDSDGTPVPTIPKSPNYIKRVYSSSVKSGVLNMARREALQGYRPLTPPPPSQPSLAKGKGKSRRPSTKKLTIMKVGRIVFFPCGEKNIYRFLFPTISSAALDPWVKAGLAIEADPETEEGFVFPTTWGTKQFNAFLRDHFPKLFNHFESTNPGIKTLPDEPDNIGTKKIDYTLPYILLKKDRKKYHLVDIAHPTAAQYKVHTTGERGSGGFRSKGIFLITKDPFPQDLLNAWFAPSIAPHVPTIGTPEPVATGAKRKRRNLQGSVVLIASDSGDGTDGTVKTDTEEIKSTRRRPLPTKRARVFSPSIPPPSTQVPQFVQGSSRDQDLGIEDLSQRLEQSASFNDPNNVWIEENSKKVDCFEF